MKKKFELDWNFCNPYALDETIKAMDEWIKKSRHDNTRKSLRVRDVMMEIVPDVYENFSGGDKCRVGKAVSIMFNLGYYPELCRGKKKGVTNTYYVK